MGCTFLCTVTIVSIVTCLLEILVSILLFYMFLRVYEWDFIIEAPDLVLLILQCTNFVITIWMLFYLIRIAFTEDSNRPRISCFPTSAKYYYRFYLGMNVAAIMLAFSFLLGIDLLNYSTQSAFNYPPFLFIFVISHIVIGLAAFLKGISVIVFKRHTDSLDGTEDLPLYAIFRNYRSYG